METIIFMFCLTLHNIEEALWFPDWRAKTLKNAKPQNKNHFIFAVIGVTILGYLAAGLHLLYPDNKYLEYAFIGFVVAMLINAVVPHLVLTIAYRKYCPGVFTGCFLLMPFHIIILLNALGEKVTIAEAVISALVIGLILLGSIQILMKAAKTIFNAKG